MDLRTEQIAKGLVDHPVLLQDQSTLEGGGDDQKVEVPTTARGARVALVMGALVAQLEVGRLEALIQNGLDPLRRRHGPRVQSLV